MNIHRSEIPKSPISTVVRIEPGSIHDEIIIGNTGVVFNLSKQLDKSLEFAFTQVKEVPDAINLENMYKLSLGLLGFYRWANSDDGKSVVADSESVAGNTSRKFFDALYRLLEKSGHPEIFLTYYDGTQNFSAGIHADKFAALPINDPLIVYLEKIEARLNYF